MSQNGLIALPGNWQRPLE